MLSKRSNSILLLSSLLCVLSLFCLNNVLLLSTVRADNYESLTVSVESPQPDREYDIGVMVPVRVVVANVNASAMANTTILGTTNWDMQFVHVPFLEVTHENQSDVVVFAPQPNMQLPQNGLDISGDALTAFNNQGFLRLPTSSGDWLVTLEIDPHSATYSPYQARIAVHVQPQTPIGLYLIVAGWVGVIVVGVFLLRRRRGSRSRMRKISN